MFVRVLVGVALFMGGAAPAFAGYVSPPSETDLNFTSINNPYSSIDGDDSSYTYFFTTNTATSYGMIRHYFYDSPYQNVIALKFTYLPVGNTGDGILYQYSCVGDENTVEGSLAITVSKYTQTIAIPSGCYLQWYGLKLPLGGAMTGFALYESAMLKIEGLPYTVEITSSVISDLLANATFSAVIESPEKISNFLTFTGYEGGIHSWIWGFIFMSTFFVGMIFGARL